MTGEKLPGCAPGSPGQDVKCGPEERRPGFCFPETFSCSGPGITQAEFNLTDPNLPTTEVGNHTGLFPRTRKNNNLNGKKPSVHFAPSVQASFRLTSKTSK